MEIVTIYQTVVTSDLNHDGWNDVVIGRFLTESAAMAFGKGKNVHGTDAKVRPADAFRDDRGNYRILGADIEVYSDEIDIKRKNALAKLTREERELLGLPPF